MDSVGQAIQPKAGYRLKEFHQTGVERSKPPSQEPLWGLFESHITDLKRAR